MYYCCSRVSVFGHNSGGPKFDFAKRISHVDSVSSVAIFSRLQNPDGLSSFFKRCKSLLKIFQSLIKQPRFDMKSERYKIKNVLEGGAVVPGHGFEERLFVANSVVVLKVV